MRESFGRLIRRFLGANRGNVALITALSMPVLLGSVGIGAEVASWYGGKRAMQNAADSAAIAAASNASDTYDDEARAVAARYGFVDGQDGVTVSAADGQPCPRGGKTCYAVSISRVQPVILAQVVGFDGDLKINGAPAKRISAKALAIQANSPREYCVLALAGSGDPQAIRTNGSPKADLSGCSVMSNSDARCNGHNLNADYGDAHGINDTCGKRTNSHVDKVDDPYAGLKAHIPVKTCGSTYYTAPEKKKDPQLPSSNRLHGLETRSVIDICGDAELSGPVFISSSGSGTVLVIRNGSLNLNGYTLQTMAGASLTVIFTGNDNNRDHRPVGDGTFDIKAPTSGPWSGVAIYQDPDLTGGINITEAGNTPTWNITGLVYLPKASVTFSGAVNKSSEGASCFGLVVDNLIVNGTASIFAHGECPRAGLTLPYSFAPSRGELVS